MMPTSLESYFQNSHGAGDVNGSHWDGGDSESNGEKRGSRVDRNC